MVEESIEIQEFNSREKSGGFQVNLFYHVTKRKLVWIGNNLDLVKSITTRKFPDQLFYTKDGVKMDVSRFVKNLIPATNKNIKQANEGMPRIPLEIQLISPQLDSSTFTISEWYKPNMKNELKIKKIKRNSEQFKDYLDLCLSNLK